MMAITLTTLLVLTAVRRKALTVSSEVTGKEGGKNKVHVNLFLVCL